MPTRLHLSVILIAVFALCGMALADELTKASIPADWPPQLRTLIEQTFSDDAKARGDAAKQLGKEGKSAEPAVPFLIRLLDDNSRLGFQSDHSGVYRTVCTDAIAALVTIGDSSVDPCIAALSKSSGKKRYALVKILGNIKDVRAVRPLGDLLSDEDSVLRQNVVISLSRWTNPDIVPVLILALEDKDHQVRYFASKQLGDIHDFRAVEPLVKGLKDSNDDVRCNAARALGEQGDSLAVPALVDALQNGREDPWVRYWAGCALGQVGSEPAIDALLMTVDDRNADQKAREGAARGLVISGDKRAKERLAILVKDAQENVDVRVRAIKTLKEKDGKAWSPLFTALAKNTADDNRVQFWAAMSVADVADGAIDDPDIVRPLFGYNDPHDTISGLAERREGQEKVLKAIADHGTTEAARKAAVQMLQRLEEEWVTTTKSRKSR